MSAPPDVQAAFCAVLVDEWVRAGVRHAVVCPGSRSTPMLLALEADGRLSLHVVLDERAAGFVALGIGRATGVPAAVVTTSGTAAVELHPAVVEADHGGVPLLAVTADRPPELHHVGAPQTVEQAGLFGSSPRWSFDPGPVDPAASGAWRSLGARSVEETRHGPRGPGPVHLNLAFREPLVGEAAGVGSPPGRAGGDPWHAAAPAVASALGGPAAGVAAGLARGAGGPGLIVAGEGAGDPDGVLRLSGALGWPVLADPPSGCRVPGPLVVAAGDSLLRVPEVAARRPRWVLRLGRPAASKVQAAWLAGLGGEAEQVLVDPFGRWSDPDRSVATVVRADPAAFCSTVAAAAPAPAGPAGGWAAGGWAAGWAAAESAAQQAIDDALDAEAGLTEPGIARTTAAALADGATLVVSSSMPVRDVEWFSAPRRALRVVANRGANGIDGVVATTVGTAVGSQQPCAGLLGDLAFAYDAGSLLWARDRPLRCTLVVVDNDGGGIFEFLPQAHLARSTFERLWGTAHGLDLVALARAYGADADRLGEPGELLDVLGAGMPAGVRVVVARTDRRENVRVHERIAAAVAAGVGPVVRGS